ncbi:hypothetical protein RHGRI_028833 [Rhododendron griersonianum]|uniref:2-hydroxyacyl-CoA lyase n=1 Tax=Rhododendron griersonianum TaxID=479676 RepID=A0AAV6ILZ7_9ERIC|nr:hypothetical protein RHGRI_028833 [Rhododendron griersonianum]
MPRPLLPSTATRWSPSSSAAPAWTACSAWPRGWHPRHRPRHPRRDPRRLLRCLPQRAVGGLRRLWLPHRPPGDPPHRLRPGRVHGLAGLSNAATNAWPMIMISGSCDQGYFGKGDFQELDQVEAVKPFSKLSFGVRDIRDVPSEAEADELLVEAEKGVEKEVIGIVGQSEIEKAVSLLRHAERPLIVFGKGAAITRAENGLKKLVETTGILFLPTPTGKGLLPNTHELAVTAARSLAIVVVGARLNWWLHFGEPPKWSKYVKFILVDISKEEIELRKLCLGLVGDAAKVVEMNSTTFSVSPTKPKPKQGFLSSISSLLISTKMNFTSFGDPFCLGKTHPWVEAIQKKANENVLKMEAQLAKDVVPFNFLTPMRIIRDAILGVGSPAPIVVSEGANTMDVGRSVLVQTEPRTRLDAGTWGTMGVGLGYCIAAAVASPDRLVVAVEGDSGFGFSTMEVDLLHQKVTPCISARRSTLVRYQLPVVVIVFNNGGVYGGDRRSPEEITGTFKDDPAPTSFVPGAAYHLLIEAFGGKGYLVGTPNELKSALTESFAARKPAVVNVTIDPYAGAESGRLQHKN